MMKKTPQNDNADARTMAVQAVEAVCAEWERLQQRLVSIAYPKAQPIAPDDYVRTNVINVCYYGDMPSLQILIEQSADLHIDNEKPLHMAADAGQTEMVRFLLNNNADIHATEDLALRWAVRQEHFGTADLLVERGADVSKLRPIDFHLYAAYKVEQEFYHEKLSVIHNDWQAEKNLTTIFNAKTWAGHVNEMVTLWNQVPEPLQRGIDFSHMASQARQESLRKSKTNKPIFVR
jgi:hypothetical protein